MTRRTIGQLALFTLISLPQGAAAIGTAFTYQGQLQQSGSLGTGPCDFRFMLFDSAGSGSPPTGGNQIGNAAAVDAVQVSNGLFTLRLDFGAAAFNTGSDRWLQIAVRCPAGSGSYQTLAPRQPLTPAPFALFANTVADGSVSSAKLAPGAVMTSQLATNSVTAAQIADGTITTNDLANAAVTTVKIGDGQVTAAKLVAPLRLTSSVANTMIGAFDGTSTAMNGVGVSGTAGSGDDAVGVLGFANAGAGVFGESSNGDGVRGLSQSQNGDGVFGESTGSGDGVRGVSEFGAGVHGQSTSGTGVLGEGIDFGVKGTSADGEGVIGLSSKDNGVGVHGIANENGAKGVFGESDKGTAVHGQSAHSVGVGGFGAFGVAGLTITTDGTGVTGSSLNPDDANAVGVRGTAKLGTGVRGESDSGFAGYFAGPVFVGGQLIAGVKLFKIDHPLDPANKYLMHAAVESPEMKNIYDGVVVLDANGEARVDLPQWFEALNRDFRYQLTCIGAAAPVYVADEVNEAHFRIAGGTPGLKVSWLVTGIRKDAFAVAHPVVVESEKSAAERGRYLSPVELGMPASLSVDRAKPLPMQMQ